MFNVKLLFKPNLPHNEHHFLTVLTNNIVTNKLLFGKWCTIKSERERASVSNCVASQDAFALAVN